MSYGYPTLASLVGHLEMFNAQSDNGYKAAMRTKVILSCLVNVVNLRDGELEFYTKVRQQLLKQTDERRETLEKIEKLTAEVQRERYVKVYPPYPKLTIRQSHC